MRRVYWFSYSEYSLVRVWGLGGGLLPRLQSDPAPEQAGSHRESKCEEVCFGQSGHGLDDGACQAYDRTLPITISGRARHVLDRTSEHSRAIVDRSIRPVAIVRCTRRAARPTGVDPARIDCTLGVRSRPGRRTARTGAALLQLHHPARHPAAPGRRDRDGRRIEPGHQGAAELPPDAGPSAPGRTPWIHLVAALERRAWRSEE